MSVNPNLTIRWRQAQVLKRPKRKREYYIDAGSVEGGH
jgi:hypothetical protein